MIIFTTLAHAETEKLGIQLTDSEIKWLQQNPVITLAGTPDWAPFDFVNKRGDYAGIVLDYMNLIADITGLSYDVDVDEWDSQLQKLREKEVDLIGSAYYVEERAKYATYSPAYLQVLDYFFIRDDLQANTHRI